MSEIEKLEVIQDKSQIIGEFLEWLQIEKKYIICEKSSGKTIIPVDPQKKCTSDNIADVIYSVNWPVIFDIDKVLAEFFNIDLKKVEEEKKKILKKHREWLKSLPDDANCSTG